MRKAWLASAAMSAGLAALWAGSTSASAGVAGLIPSTAGAAHHSDGITKINHWRRYYYGPSYYSGYYDASPYDYAYAYYPPPVVYYAVPAPRYVPGPAYYPYAGYYVRPWRSRYYYGW
jgi:hypothetical protein